MPQPPVGSISNSPRRLPGPCRHGPGRERTNGTARNKWMRGGGRDADTPIGGALVRQSPVQIPTRRGHWVSCRRDEVRRRHKGPTPPISSALTMAFLTQDQQSMITRGMKSLVSLARELSSSSVNPDAHKEMQGHARHACEEMKAVESQLESQKHIVDSHYVTLLEKGAHLNNEKSQRELSQALLQIQLKHHANTKAYAQEMLSAAEGHLKELQDLQKEVRKEKNWLKIARTIALLFMPLSTLMAGIVAAIFQTSLNMAQRADQELQKAIDLYNTKISEYKQSLCRYDLEKEEIDVKSHADEKKMEALTRELLELENTMEKKEQFLRNLSLLVGNLEVLESKLDIDYETSWEVLAVDVLESLEGDQRLLNFLDGKEIRSLVQDLKKIIKSRAAI